VNSLLFISLLSLNVNNIQPGTQRFDRLVDLLLNEDPDLIALTECGPEAFEALAFELEPIAALYAPADFWGNGILSMRYPVKEWGSLDISIYQEHRSVVWASISVSDEKDIHVAALHLEVSDEVARMDQIRIIEKELDFDSFILVGDFNALNRLDYDQEALNILTTRRAQGGRSPPRWDVIHSLLDAYGFIDAAQGHPFVPTTLHLSRVDYIFFGKESRVLPQFSSYKVLNTIGMEISDHNSPFVVFQIVI
jgi:endonuclease/exonuclease/phosphatase family metal-dependent hydrolase